jgi:hypothetical protein
VFPEGCADTIVTFVVPECVSAPACPEIEIATDQSGCDEEGRRSVSIAARVRLASGDPVAASLVQIDAAGDPIDPPLAEGADAGGDLTLNASDLFQADTAPRFRVVVTQPAGCPGATVTVDLPPCEDSTEPPVVPPDDEEPVVPPDDEPPVVPPDDDTVTDGCPWWWLMPLALVLLIGGVVMTVAGACALIGPLALIGSLVGALATIPLTMWAYLCRDCPAMRALLVAGVGAFDVLAIAALVSSATGADS